MQTGPEQALAPARCMSTAVKRPPGLRSATTGVRAEMGSKSSMPMRDARLVRDREKVQDRVRRAGRRRRRRRSRSRSTSRVMNDARPQVLLDEAHHGRCRRRAPRRPCAGRWPGTSLAPMRRHAEERDRRGHRVRGVLAAAGAGAGTRVVLEHAQVALRHLAGRVRAHGLEHVLDGHVASLEASGSDRAAVEHQGRDIEPRQRHHGAGEGLVAPGERDDAVEHVRHARRARSSRR